MEMIYLLRLLAAIVAGAVVGFEREMHDKPAGFRTNILICFGAALFTVMSMHFGEATGADGSRIAAQIVTGVGFLGAGTIIHFQANVLGLTTAATIWAVASVGMAFGAGEYVIGSIATLMTAGVLLGLSYVEEQIASWRLPATFKNHADRRLRIRRRHSQARERTRTRYSPLGVDEGGNRAAGENDRRRPGRDDRPVPDGADRERPRALVPADMRGG